MFCAYTRPRYQVSVYRTIGPLVIIIKQKKKAKQKMTLIEPHREKTGFLHMRKQRRRSASR